MHRFFLDGWSAGALGEDLSADEVLLTGEEFYHAARVLRLGLGDRVMLCADGLQASGVVDRLRGAAYVVRLLDVPLPCPAEPRARVTLYPALVKADKLDYVVQKAVELGAVAICPIVSARCVVRLDQKGMAVKLTRWRRIAAEAAKQCGRARRVQVRQPIPLAALRDEPAARLLLAYENQREGSVAAALDGVQPGEPVGLVIGPEGGFEAAEVQALQGAAHLHCVTLGKRILRAETASLALLALTMHCLGEL